MGRPRLLQGLLGLSAIADHFYASGESCLACMKKEPSSYLLNWISRNVFEQRVSC